MKTEPVFGEVPLGDLFVTGPGEDLFLKVDNLALSNKSDGNVLGGNAFNIADGKKIWIPGNRIVRRANRGNFLETYQRYHLRELRERAPAPA